MALDEFSTGWKNWPYTFRHFVHTGPFNNFALFIRNFGTTRCLNFRTAKEVPCERNAWAYKFSAGRKFVLCCIEVASHFMISQHQTSGTEPIAAFSFVSLFAFVSRLFLYIRRSQPRYKKNTRALLEEINKWISFFFDIGAWTCYYLSHPGSCCDVIGTWGRVWKHDGGKGKIKTIFTLYRIGFAPNRKP